jgi:asparagine synthase (glutamine-hydrolysing)
MVGVCGALGADRPSLGPLPAWVNRDDVGEEASYDGSTATVFAATHRQSSQPISVPERDATFLAFGTVYGRLGGSSDRRPAGVSTPEYCARVYADDGIDALTELNGEFVAVVIDHDRDTLQIVTDLLGSLPVYYHLDETWLLFSTSVQSLVQHLAVDAAFDSASLIEYLARKTVRGTETLFTGIKQLPPASVTTIDLTGTSEPITHERYWTPVPKPVDRPIDRFVDRFTEAFTAAIDDRIRDDRRHGLLLSGGSDSRLLAATVDPNRAYGFSAGSSSPADESDTAARVARVIDVPFDRFELGRDRYPDFLEGYAHHGGGIGWFNEGRTLTTAETMRSKVDALVSGLYADVFFKGWSLPSRQLSTPIGPVSLPLEDRVEHRNEYLETQTAESPAYINLEKLPAADRVMEQSLVETSTGVRDHGIEYPSIADLSRTGFWFPLTNETSFDRYGDVQVLPTVFPFLDRRLIELSLELPRADTLRYNIVNRAVSRLAPELAAIPHNKSGVPLTQPRLFHWFGQLYGDRIGGAGGAKADALREPWLRSFVRDHEETIRSLPGIEYETADRLCREHLGGANHTSEICGLVSVLAMPATGTITGTESDADATPW